MLNVAVLVPSHDGFSDLWPIAAELFSRYWPDRKWPMYWLTNGQPVPHIAQPIHRPHIIREQWGYSIADALELIPEELIVFWVEEILLLSRVPNDLMLEAAEIVNANPDVGILQLTHYYDDAPVQATIGNFADYPRREYLGFSAALPALFRKELLIHLLQAHTLPNEFEQLSWQVMMQRFPGVRSLISCKPMFRFCDNALLGEADGAWRRCAVKHVTAEGFDVDFDRRGVAKDECRFMDGTPA